MENKPNKPRLIISIFDIVIIAVVIVAAAALIIVWRSSGKSSKTAATEKVRYTIELNNMIGGAAEKIKQGDTILDSDKKYIMGTVESVTIGPATSSAVNRETGDTLIAEVPGKELATIKLICDCSATDAQITAASGYIIHVGAEVHAAGPGYAGLGFVVGIDREGLGK
jgi:hypothetical protein